MTDWDAWRMISSLQGIYYFGTGIWPIVHLRSFEHLTGKKTDDWLVKTFGALVAALGIVFLWPLGRRDTSVALLGILAALAIGIAESVFASRKIISPVYLVDAVLQAAFAAAWVIYGL